MCDILWHAVQVQGGSQVNYAKMCFTFHVRPVVLKVSLVLHQHFLCRDAAIVMPMSSEMFKQPFHQSSMEEEEREQERSHIKLSTIRLKQSTAVIVSW